MAFVNNRICCLQSSWRSSSRICNNSNNNNVNRSSLNLLIISPLIFISLVTIVCLLLPVLASSSTSSETLQIADQQAFLGKLFFYRIDVPSNVQNLTFSQAGHLDSDESSSGKLPDWLYFDSMRGVLFGAPTEKKIYFIQVQAILHSNSEDGDSDHRTSPRTYDDIFVIEVVDIPAYLDYYMLYNQQQLANSFDAQQTGQQQQQQPDNQLSIFQCRLELKKAFANVKQLYQTVIELRTLFFSSDHPNHHRSSSLPSSSLSSSSSSSSSSNSVDQFKEWLNRFNAAKDLQNLKFKLSYNVEKCAARQASSPSSHILLDNNSERMSAKLTQLEIESELVKLALNFDANTGVSSGINAWKPEAPKVVTTEQQQSYRADFSSLSDSDDEIQPQHDHHHHHGHGHHHKKHHRRRNAYADDAYATPTLKKEWVTLTTSAIGAEPTNNDFELSRTLIPSMVSPTFTNDNVNQIQSTPTLPTDQTRAPKAFNPLHNYPRLYSTPILMPDIGGLHTKNVDMDNVNLATPVMPSIEPTAVHSKMPELSSSTTSVIDLVSKMPELPTLPPPQPPPPEPDAEDTSTTTTPSSIPDDNSTTPELVTILPNHRPFVNKRISKISITAGKYWQYPIPEDTFVDIEDGNTKQLHLSFFMDLESPPLDYWIQFDHENQYLYALPTEENIGKYRFNLVAVDSQGADVSESLEINVRQSRQSLAFTHQFILANITWPADQYIERIQAISTLLKRMATQVFEELPSNKELTHHESVLRSISVLNIVQNVESNSWSVIWTNDTLRRHPCPMNEINQLFSKLYEITAPEDLHGFMTPSRELRGALAPEFTIQKIKRQFIGRSACGTFASIGVDSSNNRQKDKIVISNKLNRLGPYKLGEPFRFQIPKDTVYSSSRQVDTRDLALSLAPVEPELDLPEFIYFDEREQTIYGLPFKTEHVRTYEIKLIVEDTVTGGQERDVFVIDVIHDGNTREDYLFEVTMSFLINNIEQVKRSQIKLTPKDYYQVAYQIACRLMGNSNLDSLRMLDISRHRFTKISDPIVGNYNELNEVEPVDVGTSMAHSYSNKKMRRSHPHHRRRSYHNLRFKRALNLNGDYFYEFTWTNRSLVTSYSHSSNAYGGGLGYETKTCPKDIIHQDIYDRLFPGSTHQFLENIELKQNKSNLDFMEIYSLLFETVDANVEFLSVEWTPKSVCTQLNLGLEPRILGAKPIRSGTEELDEDEEDDVDKIPTSEPPPIVKVSDTNVDQLPTQEYLGDKLLAMIIPPIAILTALLFAVAIGCCFHRANLRRKAIGNTQILQDESPSLLRKRIPIQFEFERGRGNLLASEHESMLDPKLHRQGVQVIPMKAQPSHLPSQMGRQKGLQQQPPHPSSQMHQYQMVPQRR